MSSTNINNKKRHCFDRATYDRMPHSSRKRVRHDKTIETHKKQNFHFNLGGLMAAFVIWFSLEGDPFLKAITGLTVIACSFHYWED